MDIRSFKKLPLLGILRGIDATAVEPLCAAIVTSGLKTIEITMNTAEAPKLLKKMVKTAKGRLTIGAGTVLTMKDLRAAIDSGATFIVLPTLVQEVVEYCVKKTIPVFPGAFTPQEIYNAWRAGATMVKVFPAKFFGPEYLREIKEPFQDIELLACGGVTAENLRTFFNSGASAVAFGASVFKHEWLSGQKFALIEKSIAEFVKGYRQTSPK
ncbi:MAG: bifunctional 4-hydroxy-2-oxoglutarate aldolase/2-dehydro-3-deoxy-phosphogluconate aldolase [Candidatus Omnitrophota bacterium]